MNKRTSGGSRHSVNNAPTRGGLADPQTYGMLLWQSKLQEKLLQEQKEKKQKDLEEQQRQIEERHQTEQQERIQQQRARQTPTLEIPQMMPRPAPYTVTTTPRSPQPPVTPMSPEEGGSAAISGSLIPNGETPTERAMFPSISNRMRSSVSCDNFGKPPSLFLGNIVSFQQMGGAGSPRRTPSGKLVTVLRGDPEIRYHQKDTRGFDQSMRYLMDREKVTEYKRELDLQIEEKRKWRSQVGSAAIKEITRKGFIENSGNNNSKSYTSAGSDYLHHNHHHPLGDSFSSGLGLEGNNKNGTELAPLMRMRKFNSLPKLNSLSSTDVTRPYVHSPRNEFFHPIQANEVAENLHSQLKEKEWLTRRHQENERLATQRHFQTWDSLWGRPGAGAPLLSFMDKSLGHAVSSGNLFGAGQQQQRMGHNKVNLFKAIHMTHQQQNKPQ